MIIRIFAAQEPAKPLNDAQMCGSFLFLLVYGKIGMEITNEEKSNPFWMTDANNFSNPSKFNRSIRLIYRLECITLIINS